MARTNKKSGLDHCLLTSKNATKGFNTETAIDILSEESIVILNDHFRQDFEILNYNKF